MATAPRTRPQQIRATITLGPVEGVDGRIGETMVVVDDDVHVAVDLLGDDDMIALVSHMFSEGDTFGGHVVPDGDRFVLVHVDDLTDVESMFEHEQEPTGDAAIDAVMAMCSERMRPEDEAGDFVLSGIPGIRLVTEIVRGDDGECNFDRQREHVLLGMTVPEDGMTVRAMARALWAANYAEYAQTVAFVESRLAEAEGRRPSAHRGVFEQSIRSRTLLAAMGLVPATTGRSYHVCDMHWTGCRVRTAADGWIEATMRIDT